MKSFAIYLGLCSEPENTSLDSIHYLPTTPVNAYDSKAGDRIRSGFDIRSFYDLRRATPDQRKVLDLVKAFSE